MLVSLSDLERMLFNEQKTCDDHVIMGGVEQFINKWAAELRQGNDPAQVHCADQVVERAQGLQRRRGGRPEADARGSDHGAARSSAPRV